MVHGEPQALLSGTAGGTGGLTMGRRKDVLFKTRYRIQASVTVGVTRMQHPYVLTRSGWRFAAELKEHKLFQSKDAADRHVIERRLMYSPHRFWDVAEVIEFQSGL